MNQEDYFNLATIIRGIYLNATGLPWVVIPEPGSGRDVPGEAITVDIASLGERPFDEDGAAKVFYEAFAAWEFDRAPAGVEAAAGPPKETSYPSCVAVKDDDGLKALYWVDGDLDAAQKRKAAGDASLWTRKTPPASRTNRALNLDAGKRGEVVKNRIALVTGGAQGLGEEIVRGLCASGALVFIADLNLEGAEKLAKQINTGEKRTAAIAVPVNVAEEASVKGLFRTLVETAGGLDLCISNAGVLRAGSVLDQELRDFQFSTDINYTGYFLMVKHAGKVLRRQHGTAPNWKTDIIQINSKSGLAGSNKNAAYAGGKFGGIGLTASFALELVDYQIKVNAICPGNFFDGPLWSDPEKGLFVQYLKAGKVPLAKTLGDVRAFYEAKVPMKRGCTGADLMRAIYYIVEQEYETGQAIPVTGGQVMLH